MAGNKLKGIQKCADIRGESQDDFKTSERNIFSNTFSLIEYFYSLVLVQSEYTTLSLILSHATQTIQTRNICSGTKRVYEVKKLI